MDEEFPTGTVDVDVGKKMSSKHKLLECDKLCKLSDFFSEGPFHPNSDVKPIYLHDTRRDMLDQVMEGPCKVFFHVPYFVDHQ